MRRSPKVLLAVALSLVAVAGCALTPTAGAAGARGSEGGTPMTAAAPAAPRPPVDPSLPRISPKTYAAVPAAELKARLTPLQFEVTQNAFTEPPFQNAYFDNHDPGIYVDVTNGEPLFSSLDKFESGTGWPSFTRPIEAGRVVSHEDTTFAMVRTEVVSAGGGSHLGHVFDDGPAPTHRRYCIDSAALRFIPVDRLAAEGYGAYAPSFGVAAAPASPTPATSNSCAMPPPGTTPGCNSTLDVAIFARADGDQAATKPDGVLDITSGWEGSQAAVQVTFDPSKVTYPQLLAAWTKGRERSSLVYARTDAQKQAAGVKALKVTDAVPFKRR